MTHLFFAFCLYLASLSRSTPNYDANCNGTVDAVDALYVLQVEAGMVTNCGNADVNRDGVVNVVDSMLIRQYVAGLI